MQSWIFSFRSRSFILLVVFFSIITFLVYFDVTKNFDNEIILVVKDAAGNYSVDLLMQIINETGDIFYMFIFGIVLMILKKTRRIGITLMILLVISTLLTGYIKCGIDRDRPDETYVGSPFPVEISRDTFALFCEGGITASYPSGHATRAIIFAIVLGFALSERFPRGAYLLFAYPVSISISRIYVLQHYPMDVIGGIVLGVLLTGVLANQTKLYKIFEKSKS